MRQPQIILIVALLLIAALFIVGVGLGLVAETQPVDPQRLGDGFLGAVAERLVVARAVQADDLSLGANARPGCRLGESLLVPAGGACAFNMPYTSDLRRTIDLRLLEGDRAVVTLRVPGVLTQRGELTTGQPFAATLNRGDEGRTTLIFIECPGTSGDCKLVLEQQ